MENYAFVANFDRGSFINNLISSIKITNNDGGLCISKSGITYGQTNGNGSILNQFVIYSHLLGERNYYYNSQSPNIIFGLSIEDLKPLVNCLAKDGLRLCFEKEVDDLDIGIETIKDNLIIQKYDPNNPSGNGSIKTILKKQISEEQMKLFQSDIIFDDTRNWNCEIPVKKFTDDCTEIVSSKPNHITIIGYPNGLVINSKKDGNITKGYYPFGYIPHNTSRNTSDSFSNNIVLPDLSSLSLSSSFGNRSSSPKFLIENPSSDKILEITVDISAIKMMKKFSGVCYKDGFVKVYVDPASGYMEFAVPIGPAPGIGYLIVTLRDVNVQTDSLTQNALR